MSFFLQEKVIEVIDIEEFERDNFITPEYL